MSVSSIEPILMRWHTDEPTLGRWGVSKGGKHQRHSPAGKRKKKSFVFQAAWDAGRLLRTERHRPTAPTNWILQPVMFSQVRGQLCPWETIMATRGAQWTLTCKSSLMFYVLSLCKLLWGNRKLIWGRSQISGKQTHMHSLFFQPLVNRISTPNRSIIWNYTVTAHLPKTTNC